MDAEDLVKAGARTRIVRMDALRHVPLCDSTARAAGI